MKTTIWNPVEFLYWYQRAPLEKKTRAWDSLTSEQLQLVEDLDMLRRFAKVAPIDYEPYSELALDPNSASPPPPDFVCSGGHGFLYFELMPNHLIHAYFDVDLDIVWTTIEQDVPSLLPALEPAVAQIDR